MQAGFICKDPDKSPRCHAFLQSVRDRALLVPMSGKHPLAAADVRDTHSFLQVLVLDVQIDVWAHGLLQDVLDLGQALVPRCVAPQLEAVSVHVRDAGGQVLHAPRVRAHLCDGSSQPGVGVQHAQQELLHLHAHRDAVREAAGTPQGGFLWVGAGEVLAANGSCNMLARARHTRQAASQMQSM